MNSDSSEFKKQVKIDLQSEKRAKQIILALRKIMHHMDNHSRRLNKCYGLTVPQIICLYEIYEKGMMTLSILSINVHLSMSTLVGVVDRLEEKGFLQRIRDLKDRRIVFLNITDKGTEFVSSSPYLLHNRLNDKLQDLTETEQINLANSINILMNVLKEL